MSEQRAREANGGLVGAFVCALGQLTSLDGSPSRDAWPDTRRTPAEALRGDWERLGGDMRRAARKALAVERT
jgi:hypothetical protein